MSILTAYLILELNYSLYGALELIAEIKPDICPNVNFLHQLRKLEKRAQEELAFQ